MEQQGLTTAQPEAQAKAKNPARKWLFVSLGGIIVCVLALGFYFTSGGSTSSDPFPKKVLSQVFGFTPYYYESNKPPGKLHLVPDSPRFIGNALTFKLANSKNQSVTVSEKTLPANYTDAQKSGNESFESQAGIGTIGSVQSGHITAGLITKDKTLILLDSTEIFNPDILKDILNNLVAIR